MKLTFEEIESNICSNTGCDEKVFKIFVEYDAQHESGTPFGICIRFQCVPEEDFTCTSNFSFHTQQKNFSYY